ncbi:MAG: hypothetical protein JWL92_587 [Candidatus Nomurabacteria bacterium]|nr:hypothetical protein [Candidatus Nomurabacteria bacterium]
MANKKSHSHTLKKEKIMKKVLLVAAMLGVVVLTSCSKKSDPTPTVTVPVVTVTVRKFIPEPKDPYTGAVPIGARTYMLLKAQISGNNNTFSYLPVYTNHENSGPYGKDGNIYYNPVPVRDSLRFGSKVFANSAEFRGKVNTRLTDKGYVVLGLSADGGPEYINYEIIEIGQATF